eukprot:scaffold60459_cov31-Tisochrysis_lutea.AAC.5
MVRRTRKFRFPLRSARLAMEDAMAPTHTQWRDSVHPPVVKARRTRSAQVAKRTPEACAVNGRGPPLLPVWLPMEEC